ncbi:PREDICTED: protein unc-80 homolog isoform X4 [Dinoponera quadriceps]|uniref:Protein unc-80 homolog isoform X4 n=1 Tax=Dinoponera quadriceps TaxID=609295 RepID=A0A6P3WT07_DINQU|nr:PREDICTED: protein unc-80 homolog isoform X4 [Dinoponera quadriceps]
MDKRRSLDGGLQEHPLPIPVQMFLWRQLRPFIRAKLGKLHEASCTFCQHAPGHHEMKEACTCLEKVLVQNLHNDLTPSLSEILSNVPRWRLIQAALPYVLHAAASILHNRKDFQSIGAMETTLLYILHWILLDSAEECAENEADPGNPFHYLFPIPTLTLFVYLFAPLCNHLKDIDFRTNLRLENGLKIWPAMYECRHPEASCFTTHCRAKPRLYWSRSFKSAKHHMLSDDVFVGGNVESPLSQSISAFSDQSAPPSSKVVDDDQQSTWLSSPKDTVFPETIPEESSGAEDEHVVIFRLPSLSESEKMIDGVKEVSTIFAGEASIFHVAMGRTTSSSRSTLTIEQVTAISGFDTCKQYHGKTTKTGGTEKEKEEKPSKTEKETQEASKTHGSFSIQRQSAHSDAIAAEHIAGSTAVDVDVRAATFLDVATLRCLFVPQWQEEGVFWALQFLYYRLRRINEESSVQQMPRRRSNSLPIPKIEVSIYQSPESKKKDVLKEFIEVPETRDVTLLAGHDVETSHTRRASEKTKKRMKMADLKAFVETKLLSKSEKALEKIGQDEPKMLFEQECHRSLDTGDDHLMRQASTSSKIFEAKDVDYMKHPTNLIKGKSMPSLSCLINELTAGGYVGDTRVERKQSSFYSQSCTAPNPIITVTEHTPTPSPDYMKRQGSIESQLDAISMQGGHLCSERKPSLTRSQTDSNITYMSDEVPEAPGSACYITKEGDVDLQVALKAIHSVALRDNTCCTPRVCEIILNLVELLMDMGVMKHCLREETTGSNAGSGTGIDKSETGKKQDSPTGLNQSEQRHDLNGKGKPNAHNLLIHCVIRVVKHLGCPYGCLEGVRGPQADICRSQGQTILTKLHRASSRQFSKFLRTMMREQPLIEILDFFHSYVGYCVDPSSLLSPLNQKRISSKSPDVASQSGYATNFGAGMMSSGASGAAVGTSGGTGVATASGVATSYNTGGYGARGIEGQIISCIFKVLVTRLVDSMKQLKAQENIGLYCDVRQLMTYVKEAHGGIFRRVTLSGILDSADRPNKRCNSNVQTTRVIRHIHQSDLEEHADIAGDTCFTVDDRGTRKFLFKKRSTSSCAAGSNLQSLLETELSEENVKISQSPLGANLRKKHHVLTPRQSERNLGVGEPSMGSGKMRKSTRFQIGGIVNWFRKEYSRTDSTDSHESSESPTDGSFVRQPSFHYGPHRSARTGRGVGLTLQKAKRRMEDQLNKIGFGKSKKKESLEEAPGSYFSRRDSMELGEACRESEFVVLKERRLIPRNAVFEGMLRFSFLLETCQPGSVPDPHLMASLLDLPYAPVVSRACMILECAHLVHQCNKGHWPTWMKHNFPMFRPSMPINNRNAPSALRRIHVLQRTAGKLFYQWAEAIGTRLEEFLAEDKQNIEQVTSIVSDESKQRDLVAEDEEEDFLDDASINSYGSQCPFALRLVACVLLLEVTAFLRETYQTLPKSSKLLTKERPPPWERTMSIHYSREANRRWSLALSSMGHSQTSAQSLQSIVGDREAADRKISFVVFEPDYESEGSSKSTVTIQGEENIEKEKAKRVQAPQGRPFLLRRSTAGTGSFKKRSLKLRRNTKEGKDIECEAYAVKRADSIQSKRKVSSLSDRSDTSEPGVGGEVSGEESPGILSDDQPPESPSDSNETDETNKNFPWMKVLAQLTNSFNFYCSHQNFCHPFCHRRQMRASSRLIKSVRKIYGEEFGVLNGTGLLDTDKKEDGKKDKRGRKVSDLTSTQVSPVRRKDSVGRKYKIEKDGSQSGRLTQRDSSKDLAEQDSEKGKESLRKSTSKRDVEKDKEPPAILKYIKTQVKDAFHAPLATLIKGAVVMTEDQFVEVLPVAWELLLESNQEVAASAAALFIVSAVRAPNQASELMQKGLQHTSTSVRINAILRFQVLWKLRYQVWPRMEEAAHLTFKVPPPGIEFTLPSPKIGIESLPVVDPPWMPQVKTKVEEVTINQERHRSLVTATKTRKKQQTELIKKALQAQDDKKREERENFLITTIPITVQAAYEPSPIGDDHDEGNVGDEDAGETVTRNMTHHGQSALSLFPSSLCSAIVQIINLLDDPAVSDDGNAVYEVAYQVIWSCLVEDSALFLRYVLERLTRDQQELMFKILRHLIRFVPKLPQQAAFALYNYIIGYVMFYVRSPHEGGQKLIGTALSILWMVVHSVHGIMFKDLKQILRKEQCDASILLTANVPSAKKIIVHGPQDPDAGEIPSQFPVQEDTQFCQILRESLDFFGIEESKQHEYFLVDYKTHQIHNPSSYVRDYYFFKRSQFPQIELVHMKPEDAFNLLQQQELMHKFVEIGKVLLTWAILKNVDMVVQRVVFLHEELMKLPSFPRKALEANLDLYKGGEIGRELLGLDVMHKFMWVRLIARMFEAMAGNFAYSGDIHLFLNVLNGAVILHSEDSCILRYVVATYINAAHNFKNIFSTNGYLLIMPTLLQLYSTHQTNKLVTTTVEYAVKQFYLMNRKPFILQMFGSVSTILDTDVTSLHGEAHKVPSTCLFNLLLSLETPSPDPLNIGELVKEEKPLKAIDFCYHDENEMVNVLDCISLCVMVIAYAPDAIRGRQMLIILEAILPCYVQQIQSPTYNKDGKTEKEIINQLAIAVKTLVNNSEALTKYVYFFFYSSFRSLPSFSYSMRLQHSLDYRRYYNGPQKSSPEHKGSSQRNYGKGPYSPGFDFEDDTHTTKYLEHSKVRNFYDRDNEDVDNFHRYEFRRPRDTLLNMVGDFVARCSARLIELNKKSQDGKTIELLDSKCHVRLVDIAHSLLKISPYDPTTMGCRGLRRYMNDILPSTEWSADDMRPALMIILRRLDKTFSKIHKKASIRRNTDWAAASDLLKGVYETLLRCPYIAHFQYLKTLLNTCQALIVGDTPAEDVTSASAAALMSKIPPQHFCSTVLRLIALHVISYGEGYSLENVLGGQAMFASQTRTENTLLNLMIPLFLRVGTGRKDVPRLRQSDISFALTAVLNALWPPGVKTVPLTAQTLKTTTDMRTGSLTFAARDPKTLTKTSLTLYQVAFLALKIMTICFETELKTEWPRILRTMRLLNKRNEASIYLWNFLEFVVTHRTALYIQMLPFIVYKIGQAPISEHERNMHTIIREKINGSSTTVPKSRGALLMDLIHDLKNLKEEIEDRRFDEIQPEPKRSVVDMHPIAEGQPRAQRPSLLMDFLTGDLTSKAHINRTPAETPVSYSTAPQSQPHSTHQSNSSSTVKTTQPSQVTAPPNGSVSSTSAGSSTLREASDTFAGEMYVEQQPSTARERRFQPSSTSDERNHVKLHPILPHQKAPKLRFVSSVEFRRSSGETLTSQLSPSSPTAEDSSGELRTDKPRLQRSMGQSKKTFRLRKSRKAHIEARSTDLQLAQTEQPDATLEEESTSQPKATISSTSAVESFSNIPSDSSSIRSKRGLSSRKSDPDKNSAVPGDPQFYGATYQHHHSHYYHHHLHPQMSDVSWDEDTSSTSGYRESYSMHLVSLDGNNARSTTAPPLASPDLNDIPSTSSTTTNYIGFDGSSPDCSINGSGGEKTALLTSSQRTTSQHSLLMVFPNQDEDTLI